MKNLKFRKELYGVSLTSLGYTVSEISLLAVVDVDSDIISYVVRRHTDFSGIDNYLEKEYKYLEDAKDYFMNEVKECIS